MSEESPAQRSARLRRERREAKIKEGGSARLDKITSLSGRTTQPGMDPPVQGLSKQMSPPHYTIVDANRPPEREEASPSPQPLGPQSQLRASPAPQPDMESPEAIRAQQEAFFSMLRQSAPDPSQGIHPDPQAPNSMQAQQDMFRAMLRQSAPEQGAGAGTGPEEEDPTIKLLNSLMGAMPGGDPSAAGAGATPGSGAGAGAPGLGSSLPAIATMLGVPPFLANMLGGLGGAAPTEAEQKRAIVWKTLHTIFALAVAGYLLFIIGASVALFGSSPPPPATAQSPFAIFVTGELILTGGKALFGGKSGMGMAVQLFRDVVRDGSIVLFMLGMGTWYHPEWQAVEQ
ncbi:hypothetical protein MYU51_012871 [Penicillium brevicompactum]|uniref:GET complex subunit GET2 n=1 Tax=Penicillium brevicompactum TaxID=5074 RepID=UPI0025421611|nr:GET complex subunit GET2 [Penicillium brevicompactum]KAJ5318770.1 GET complex subunit GET2 [Penicillium brevicompactum]